ncbi:inositol 2-dehydrogenase [Serratia ficaria]|uniref:inositol 2-dehydrogenase n=1 Tax=Serratia ficaria TaxID=61651 RepID=UPI00077C28B2|nr:inositol 2-dehydrogenase [Serratia ficaria]CAI1666984.1 Inositol 2-dehydrogenase [Serratia ficaria]CAI1667451.1 Inositol 2-dehydrogenase [Serratia ficaria]CAI2433515.1 Inositol 2-dehydrogenase [Serratia ficaria]CAI2459101.1 Inositol 2-dehydrogenase [Serratia ficaria]CAI2507468.1 Inositol 2-dehydrogenase [Serratia ficaria]
MIKFAILGAGRIGQVHAANVAGHSHAQLAVVADPLIDNAKALTSAWGGIAMADPLEAIHHPQVDAVVIGTPTHTHVDLMLAAARAGKAVLCEKPVDLDIRRASEAEKALGEQASRVMLGFNRRFDQGFSEIHQRLRQGDIGTLHQVIITSRDPGLAPMGYLQHSGGIFRDMVIHDFDLARWILGEEPTEVFATGSRLFEPALEALGDYDTVMVQLRTASGKQCQINCSRQAVYGYDQRMEVFGSGGMLLNDHQRATTVRRYGPQETEARGPLLNFFMERYSDAYRREIDAFISAIKAGTAMPITVGDGCRALKLANAAQLSADTHAVVILD